MSQRVRNAKFQQRTVKMLSPSTKSRRRLKIEEKLAKFGPEASLQFDSEAWATLITEQRQLIAQAAGVDPSKVKIFVGH